jgi:hypothetical protein
MKRRRGDATTTAVIVLEGLKGQPVADLCPAHHSSPSQYYPWRDQFLAHIGHACEPHQATKRAARLAQENARLKPRVGELPLA